MAGTRCTLCSRMRRLGAFVIAAAMMVACSGGARTPVAKPQTATSTKTPAQIAAGATPAIVSIQSSDSLGTGFVVRADGWIATNLHVIAGADQLVVVLPDKSEHPV